MSRDFVPLNPLLFRQLQAVFGENGVTVTAPGEEISWKLHRPVTSKTDRMCRKVVRQGEEYMVRCPFCNDWKPRLYINHRWGVWDPDTETRNLWLAHCFNEECLADYARQEQLYHQVYGVFRGRKDIKLNEGREPEAIKLAPAEPPGPVTRLDELAENQPGHPAVRYLRGRRFDPVKLGRLYDVSYCAQSKWRWATNRIIIPICERGVTYGWQARNIGETYCGQSLKEAGVPKYWTLPGTRKEILGYRMEIAVRHQTVVLVEGPMDVWGFGSQSFGLIGKTISTSMVRKLDRWTDLYWGEDTTTVVLLDPDKDPVATKKGKPHHIEEAVKRLRDGLKGKKRDRVLPVYLPSGSDPGSLDRSFMWQYVRNKAAEAGVPVRFDREGCLPAVDNQRLLDAFNYEALGVAAMA